MNRVIKFRGLWEDGTGGSEWVYGFCCRDTDGDHLIQESSDLYTKAVITNPETIGQFTGILDKNGKEIYEGDIVRTEDSDYQEIQFIHESFEGGYLASFMAMSLLPPFAMSISSKDEIIGNIHDNPELMEVHID